MTTNAAGDRHGPARARDQSHRDLRQTKRGPRPRDHTLGGGGNLNACADARTLQISRDAPAQVMDLSGRGPDAPVSILNHQVRRPQKDDKPIPETISTPANHETPQRPAARRAHTRGRREIAQIANSARLFKA